MRQLTCLGKKRCKERAAKPCLEIRTLEKGATDIGHHLECLKNCIAKLHDSQTAASNHRRITPIFSCYHLSDDRQKGDNIGTGKFLQPWALQLGGNNLAPPFPKAQSRQAKKRD